MDSSPDWIGTWELTEEDARNEGIEEYYVSLSEEELRAAVRFSSNVNGSDCMATTLNVTEIDGNVITVEEQDSPVEIQVSGNTMTVTELVGEQEAKFTRVDDDLRNLDALRDLVGCEQ